MGRTSLEPGQWAGPSWVRQTGHQSGQTRSTKKFFRAHLRANNLCRDS